MSKRIKDKKLFALIKEFLKDRWQEPTVEEFRTAYLAALIFYYHDTLGLTMNTIIKTMQEAYEEKEELKKTTGKT